jgi:gas vesicle protein
MEDIRQEALKAFKRYRSGWVGLGKILLQIQCNDKFKEFGHETFNDYCKTELGITLMTAKEMMTAYEYIKNVEPGVLNSLESNPDAYIPDYHTIATLAKAKDTNRIDDDKEDKIRDTLFNANDENMVAASREARDMLSESSKKEGQEILDGIEKKTNQIKKKAKKLDNEIHNTSSFDTPVLEASEKLVQLIEGTNIKG